MVEPGGWGGICHYTYNLCQALSDVGCRTSLLTGSPYELAHLPRRFALYPRLEQEMPYLQKLRVTDKHLRDLGPDLVHIQHPFSARRDWAPLLILRALGWPVVFTAHNILPHDAGERDAPGMSAAYHLIYGLSDRIIVHSQEALGEIRDLFGPPPERTAVIPHGDYLFTDTGNKGDAAKVKRRLGVPASHRLVLAFGTIREYKGIPDLIDAFARIAEFVPDVSLAIVGKPIGVDPDATRGRIARLGLSDRIALRPEYVPVGDIALYFDTADIAVFPYRDICQSGALQLAYAFAKPVVVTTVGAFPETVKDGWNGILVPPADPAALAVALRRLLDSDPAHLQEMGRRSRQLAETRYSWREIAKKTLNLYTELMGKRCSNRSDN